MSENSLDVGTKNVIENLTLKISQISKLVRFSRTVTMVAIIFSLLMVIGNTYWFFSQYRNSYISFINDQGGKTVIGLKNAGRINTVTDDITGEISIEVYHGKK